MGVNFNMYSFSICYNNKESPSQLKSVKECIEYTKQFDGCSKKLYDTYSLIGSFFNVGKVDIKKLGKKYEDIDIMIEKYYEKEKNIPWYKKTLSDFLKEEIVSIKLDYKVFNKIKTPNDVLTVTTDLFIIQNCIDMLMRTNENLRQKYLEQNTIYIYDDSNSEKEYDSDEIEIRNKWEKICGLSHCKNRYYKCCLDKVSLQKISYNASILRDGSRDYSSSVQIESRPFISRVIDVLQQSIVLINTSKSSPSICDNIINFEILTI